MNTPSAHVESLGKPRFVRRHGPFWAAVTATLALTFGALVALLLYDPPDSNAHPGDTAAWFAGVAAIFAALAWRCLGMGLWFCERGFRRQGFWGGEARLYSALTSVSSRDIVVDHKGHHHTVAIECAGAGFQGKLLLAGRTSLRAKTFLEEQRDPDADAILTLLQRHVGPRPAR